MAALCRFCDQKFANTQAVRAHLKGCAAYRNRGKSGNASGFRLLPIGTSLGNTEKENSAPDGPDFDPVKQLERQVAAGRLRLNLREVEEAHAELDRKRDQKKRERKREAERLAEAARMTQEASREKLTREAAERRAREKQESAARERRRLIQEIKTAAMEEIAFRTWGFPGVKAEILQEIECALSPLAVDELPHDELMEIARGVRDPLLLAAEQEKREADDAKAQAKQSEHERAERKSRLIQQGIAYAKSELKAVDDLDSFDSLRIRLRIEGELQDIAGDESSADIEDLVEDILEDEGIGSDEDDDDY